LFTRVSSTKVKSNYKSAIGLTPKETTRYCSLLKIWIIPVLFIREKWWREYWSVFWLLR